MQYKSASDSALEGVGLLQSMFPNPDHAPTALSQHSTDLAISFHVLANFVPPEGDVRLGLSVTTPAAVPKAAIHKKRHLRVAKHKVGTPRQRGVPAPSVNLPASEQLDDLLLGALVSSPSHQ